MEGRRARTLTHTPTHSPGDGLAVTIASTTARRLPRRISQPDVQVCKRDVRALRDHHRHGAISRERSACVPGCCRTVISYAVVRAGASVNWLGLAAAESDRASTGTSTSCNEPWLRGPGGAAGRASGGQNRKDLLLIGKSDRCAQTAIEIGIERRASTGSQSSA